MKKLHILFITVCCVAAIVSCRKTETPVKPETEPEQKEEKEEKEETKTVLYGSLGETTKTYLSPIDESSVNASFKVLWEKNDEIAISKGGENKYAVYYTTEESGKDKVRFEKKSGRDLVEDDDFQAFYPASLVDKEGALQWPSEQRYKEISTSSSSGAAGNNPMWAHTTVQSGQTVMQFYNLGGVIRFKLSEPTKEFTVVKAMISADQPMSGEFALQEITLPKSETKAMKAVISDGSGDVTITPENAVTISTEGEASFYFAVPENTYTGVQITLIGDTGEKVIAKLGSGASLLVNRAEVVRLKAEGITPSIEGSNCFIGEGNVPIVIKAMGNAFDGNTALDGDDSKAVWKPLKGNVDGCEVVWETVNTVNTPTSGTIIQSATYANGVLTVVPTGTPGNALVAVKKKGVIVWSYHIWVPETEIEKVSINNDKGNFVFLDRNLGALSVTDNTKSIGLYYQWGRKDPLLGYADFNYSDLMNGGPTINTNRSISSSIQHPDCIVGNEEQQLFTSETVNQLWGWSTGSNLFNATQNKKSIYDPCPAGYRVPGDSEYINALGRTGYSTTNRNYIAKTANNNTYVINSWPSMIFPKTASLYSNGSKIQKGGDYYFVWTAIKRKTDNNISWYLNLGANGDSSVGNSTGSGSDGRFCAVAANVRCIKDTQSPAADGYTLIEMSHEHINFFE